MTTLDLEAEYNNRRRVPEHVEFAQRWAKASDEYRKTTDVQLDQSYGSGPRQRYDHYAPRGVQRAPLVAYIHGGYWQRGDRKDVGFVARPLNAAGLAVAIPSYTLAPEVSVATIVDGLRTFLKILHDRTGKRPLVIGHSAGGHLAAAMLATDWRKVPGAPTDLVPAAVALSGVFDPEPLIPTSLNGALRLDAKAARALNLNGWPPPPASATLVAAVGGDESTEFIRQSLAIAHSWSGAGVKAECVIVPGANHFTILDELVRVESALLARVIGLAKAIG